MAVISNAIIALGILLASPLLVLTLITCACGLVIAVLIVRVGCAYDKACADLIDAHTTRLADKYQAHEQPPEKPRP